METRIDISKVVPNGKIEQKSEPKPRVEVLYIDISALSQNTQFFICCLAVFVLYVCYGYLQELIFTLEGFRPYGWYLTLVQFSFYSVFSFIECWITQTKRRIPLKVYVFLAGLTLGTMGFSNSSLSFLNYPTQVIFKSCKLIPVMIGSIVIQRKKYNLVDFCAALFMCIGLAFFTLADSQMSPSFNMVGVVMISSALVCDALIGNVQEKWMKSQNASNREVILYSYSLGLLYLFVIMLVTGSLWSGVTFCADKPHIYLYALLFSLSGYLGVQVVLGLVRTCGALTAATVTTSRKAVSIIVSFVFFSKPFTPQYLWAGGLVALGIYVNILSKSKRSFLNYKRFFDIIQSPKYNKDKYKDRLIETTV